MSKTIKDDKYKKIKIIRKVVRDKDLRIQKNLEMQEQDIFEKFNIKNSMYIR
jgi:DNA-binding transcriptional regulator of glucitol operon